MTQPTRPELDRPEPRLVQRQTPEHVDVENQMRGSLDLSRDHSQHRRFTALYEDLQN